jgi:hypothetical protein
MDPVGAVAFDVPVVLLSTTSAPVRTAEQAASILRSHLRERITFAGLSALLIVERAVDEIEVEEARRAFCSWASGEQLLASSST